MSNPNESPVAAPRSIAFHTLGCRLNTSDTQRMEEEALERGMRIRAFSEAADVYVVNTCTVTAQADQQCRKLARQARARNPDAKVVLVGCHVQAQPEEVARLEGVDLALDNPGKARLFTELFTPARVALPVVGGAAQSAYTELDSQQRALGAGDRAASAGAHADLEATALRRSRAYLKVQDGCDESCSYCIIPRARGAGRSHPSSEVIEEARRLTRAGYQELVVVGVHLTEWGRGLTGEGSLATLLRELAEVQEIQRLRVSSLEPEGLSAELVDALSHPRICKHLHVSVQSGSARILKAMRRNYQPEEVHENVRRAVSALEDVGLGSDFICGFPGETAEDFEQTLRLVRELPFSYLHAFPYSERPGTDAASLPDGVPVQERKRRVKTLIALGREKRDAFLRARIGRTYQAWLMPAARGAKEPLRGLTENNITMRVNGTVSLSRSFGRVRMTDVVGGHAVGELC